MSKEKKCEICGNNYKDYGHNARPVKEGRCCDTCNYSVVIPARIEALIRLGYDKASDNQNLSN